MSSPQELKLPSIYGFKALVQACREDYFQKYRNFDNPLPDDTFDDLFRLTLKAKAECIGAIEEVASTTSRLKQNWKSISRENCEQLVKERAETVKNAVRLLVDIDLSNFDLEPMQECRRKAFEQDVAFLCATFADKVEELLASLGNLDESEKMRVEPAASCATSKPEETLPEDFDLGFQITLEPASFVRCQYCKAKAETIDLLCRHMYMAHRNRELSPNQLRLLALLLAEKPEDANILWFQPQRLWHLDFVADKFDLLTIYNDAKSASMQPQMTTIALNLCLKAVLRYCPHVLLFSCSDTKHLLERASDTVSGRYEERPRLFSPEHSMAVFPFLTGYNHYLIFLLHTPSKKIVIFDSLGNRNLQNNMRRGCNLMTSLMRKYCVSPWEQADCLSFEVCDADEPLQKDAVNCAAWCVYFVDVIAKRCVFDEELDLKVYRQKLRELVDQLQTH